jgi:hypothetical protein
MPGQIVEPVPDRQRGFTAVLVHLRSGPPPSPDGQHYNILALGPEKPMAMMPDPGIQGQPRGSMMFRGATPRRGPGMIGQSPPAKSVPGPAPGR